MRRPGVRSAVLAVAVATTLACAHDMALAPACDADAPEVSRLMVADDSTNVLRAIVTADVSRTDSIVVRYGIGAARDSATPAVLPSAGHVTTPILGLEPSRTYGARLVAFNACRTTEAELDAFTTGALPADLPSYTVEGSGAAPGYVVFGAGKYGLVIDNAGRVVWYHRFPDGPGLNFQAQPNGRYTARPPAPANVVGSWMEISTTGELTRRLGCGRDLQPRMHDMIAEPDGSYWLLCDEVRTLDLSAQGASRQSRVLGTAVQHRSATGEILFDWSPFDHLAVELDVLDPVDRNAAPINWTHGNAIDLDAEGNVLVSFRNLSEVTKLDVRTGSVLWRFGGAHNQFDVVNGDKPPFVHQHGVRAGGATQVMLLDNLGTIASRAERYELDVSFRVARLLDAYGEGAKLVAQVGGTTQTLPGGHTLVAFGSGNGVEEYDFSGRLVWRLAGNPGYVFRAQRIRSLYRPGDGDQR